MCKIRKTNIGFIAAFSLVLVTSFFALQVSPVKAETGDNIAISYSVYQTGILLVQFGEYPNTPEAANDGNVFFVVNMTIENNGYNEFNTAPDYFYVIANDAKYSFDVATNEVNNWTTEDIPNGGLFVGTLVFQIPQNSIVGSIGYSGYYNQSQSFNIVWTSVTPSPTPLPSPTPISSLMPTSIPTETPTSTSTTSTSYPPTSFLLIIDATFLIVIVVLLTVVILVLMHRKTANLKQ